ncbi:uncharacterized protein LOC128882089 [Hylaeus volcanicus]|uniref:uncharacterized protein LOC128882089 n=1 Tax=Hylaeus volcanicus TaxID=313075 RepID=UPI0023B7CCC8|nr:uncharacterized protein LOC128882089 [Hylaeus volcanicus]
MAAQALAGKILFELQAAPRASVYARVRATRLVRGNPPEPETVEVFERQAWRLALAKCRLELSSHASERVPRALLQYFKRWRERGFGRLTYRATQVFTGHGCFGVYLCRIGREATAACHHYHEEEHSAQHTLKECPAFSALRRVLRAQIGYDLSHPAVVGAMLVSEKNWRAAVSICEEVISQKEAADGSGGGGALDKDSGWRWGRLE